MSVLLPTTPVFYGDTAMVRMYRGERKVWVPDPPVWSPASIPGLVAWIDPAQDTDYGDGERIVTYREHSPIQQNFVTPLGGNGPIWRGGAHPYIEFPATDHVGLTSETQRTYHAGMTFLTVCSVQGGSYPMMVVVGPDADGVEMRHDGTSLQIVVMYSSNGIAFSHPTAMTHTKTLYALRVAPGQGIDCWTNSVKHTDRVAGPMTVAAQTLWIGRRQGGYYFVGPMYEALVYDGPVSDADLAALREYLAAKHTLYWVWE
jgi:hypothetical protein